MSPDNKSDFDLRKWYLSIVQMKQSLYQQCSQKVSRVGRLSLLLPLECNLPLTESSWN